MMAWISTALRKPPTDRVVMGKYGASVIDVGYCRVLNRWYWVIPGGHEQRIEEPPLWWDRDTDNDELSVFR
jgi:hypothetical protein